uniref:Lipid-binding serum glycoprotein N-terminal domain-containing protein n=1 Tax=Gouania willdenowi TaxID=441366 RepID=A0A8C5EPP5_GOUWI
MYCNILLLLSLFGVSRCCLQDQASAYRFTGAVCRLTYPAAVVLNDKTTKVIEAAFKHARYPSMKGEKYIRFMGKVFYGLENLEIQNLTIGKSAFELLPGEGISMEISNVSALFRGTIHYGYGNWLINITNSVDFEVESNIDLGINPKLYCGRDRVAADTSDCFLNFHKLHLHLQGDKEPNWLKKLFTDFVTFTVKLVIKGQICKEINKVANILADFIQDTAEQFLSDGDISVDIGVTAAPQITANYVESYHKGLTNYNNMSAVINNSAFHPSQLTENRMLYFWISDNILCLNSIASLPQLLFHFILCLDFQCLTESASPEFRVWSSSVPWLNTSTSGTTVWAQASAQIFCGSPHIPALFFKTVPFQTQAVHFLEIELTRLLDKQGTNLFDIFNPEVIPQDGFSVIQMDFGFPHHLLVEFLKKTLQ